MRWNRQQFIDLMTYNNVEKQMFCELFGPLVGLDKEWKKQGAREDEINLTAFGFDYIDTFTVGDTNSIHRLEPVIIEDNDDYYIGSDHMGRRVKMFKKTSTLPLPLDYPVKDMDSWLKIKHMYEFDESRIDQNQIAQAKQLQKQGTLIKSHILGGFDEPRMLLGEENLCIAYYEDPELIYDIINTISDTSFKVLEKVSREITIDQLSVHEDMAGKHAPLIGPPLIKEFIKPYYRRIWDCLNARGTKLFNQDSDGNMNCVIDSFIEAGVNVFYPCEPAADMDIVSLRKKYGKKISFKGGIDKHVLRQSKEDIKKELEYKLQPIMKTGGIAFSLDHRITNGTPIENYRYYVNTAREMLQLPPINEAEKGWGRMAF